MTVGELIEILKGYPADREVFLSSDAEGNDKNEFADASLEYYRKEGYTIETYAPEDVIEELNWADENDEEVEPYSMGVFLWPV